MKRIILSLFFVSAVLLLFSCKNSKEQEKPYVNPAYRENLGNIYALLQKKYIVEYSEIFKKFGDPVKFTRDTITTTSDQEVIDSLYTLNYGKINIYYYKNMTDNKVTLYGIEIYGNLKTPLFLIEPNESKQEVIDLLGDPLEVNTYRDIKTQDKLTEELKYGFLQSDEGVIYDAMIFTFVDDQYVKFYYRPATQTADQTTDQTDYNNL